MLTCVFKLHVKNSNNKDYILKIIVIYFSKSEEKINYQ